MNADSIRIESDEDGFHLIINCFSSSSQLSQLGVFDFRIQDIAEEFYTEVKNTIGPWLYERDSARGWAPATADFRSAEYALDDPKHPTYHERMSEIHDSREGK
jgi:hypothetical protein